MANKLPALQFYPGDWFKDPGIQALTLEEKGAWFEIILMMHESEQRGRLLLNGKPYPIEFLATALRCDAPKLMEITEKLLETGVASKDKKTGALVCRRMLREEEIRQSRIESGRAGGVAKAKQTRSKTVAKPKQKSASSITSSITSSSSEKEKAFLSYVESAVSAWNKARGQGLKPDTYREMFRKRFEKDRDLFQKFHSALPMLKDIDDSGWSNGINLTWFLRPGKGEPPTIDKILDGAYKKSNFSVAPQGRPVVDFEPEDFSKAADPAKVRQILRKSKIMGGEHGS